MRVRRDHGRIEEAVQIAEEFGDGDGSHHKQWVIDGTLRALLGDRYGRWRERYDAATDQNGEPYKPWDEGIAP